MSFEADTMRVNLVSLGKSTADLSRELGVPRSSLAMFLNGKYPGDEEKFAQRVKKAMKAELACPYLKKPVKRGLCEAITHSPVPASSPDRLRHWRACQACEHNPTKE